VPCEAPSDGVDDGQNFPISEVRFFLVHMYPMAKR